MLGFKYFLVQKIYTHYLNTDQQVNVSEEEERDV